MIKNSIHIHLASFAAIISKQLLKRRNKLSYSLLSMQISSGPNVARLRVDKYHLIDMLRIFVAEIFWPHSQTLPYLTIESIINNNCFRHTQPDVVEQNDSEKSTDFMEITSSHVFVYLSR